MNTVYAIETRKLHKRYDNFEALRGIDLHIPQGGFYGLLGPNGAGKTTTIGILTGLVNISSGEALVLGKDVIKDFRFTRSHLGLAPQELNFDPFFRLIDLLTLQAGYYGLTRRYSRERAYLMLEQFGLTSKTNSRMRELSGGMKRRVQLAKAMVHDPPIIILDEPTAGVDIELRHMLWQHLTTLNRQGKTILLTTHYIEEAEKLCDNVAIIDEGRIIAEGPPNELIKESGQTMISLKVDHWPDALDPSEWSVQVQDGQILIATDYPEKDMAQVITQVTQQNVTVEEARICRSSLEDVFIKLTGKSIDD